MAERLANVTGADLYEIVPAEPYTEADLNYGDRSTRATFEQDHPETRPEIGGEDVDLTGYNTVYVGYPIWWGEAPRILCTFVESCDFTGKTVIPFCTSGSSGIGDSGHDLARLAVPFPPHISCRFLDLPPVNLRNLQERATKNSLASRPPHLISVSLNNEAGQLFGHRCHS